MATERGRPGRMAGKTQAVQPPMTLRDRIGVDVGRKLPLEDAVAWAAGHLVRFIDVQLDTGANALGTIDAARGAAIRAGCERHGIHLGLHTASSVNVAEYAPFVGDAVDRYLEAYVDAAGLLGAEWIVVHAGFHFTGDRDERMQAGLERLRRLVSYAERKGAEQNGALILLENLNKEPEQAEIHYLAHTVEEWRHYFDRIQSPAFRLSFTANHAHLAPDGVAGFVDALDIARVHEVRLADCHRNGYEVHLPPGEGDLDFADMFRRIEGAGFRGHYMNAFGSLDDMLAGRDALVRIAEAVGLAI
jgi:sugar phosphate isomerase/epimerase